MLKLLFFCFISGALYGQSGHEIKDPEPASGGAEGVMSRATGGPDAFGYVWDDSATFQAIDITTTGTMVFSGDEVSSGPIPLGGEATFCLYGVGYDSLVMSSNGYLSTDLADTGGDLSNDCPLPAAPSTGGGARIYPLHDDLISDGYYQYFANCPRPPDGGGVTGCHVFQWANTTHFGGGLDSWSQWAILYENFNEIVFQVGAGNPETGSGSTTGIQNADSLIGLTYACDSSGSVPDNSAVIFIPPIARARLCSIYSIDLDVFRLDVVGDCPVSSCDGGGVDIYARNPDVGVFIPIALGVSLLGSQSFDVSLFPDHVFYAFFAGADPNQDFPLAVSSRAVPTLESWALLFFSLALAVTAVCVIIRRRKLVYKSSS